MVVVFKVIWQGARIWKVADGVDNSSSIVGKVDCPVVIMADGPSPLEVYWSHRDLFCGHSWLRCLQMIQCVGKTQR